MALLFDPDFFALGIAVGVLGLVLLLSLLVSYAYDEATLLFLAGYLALAVAFLLVGQRLQQGAGVQSLFLVLGPAMISGLQMWLFRKRTTSTFDRVFVPILLGATLSFLVFLTLNLWRPSLVSGLTEWTVLFSLVWGLLMGAGFVYRGLQAIETAGPWKWWLMLGHAAGLLVALLFLSGFADAKQAYWSVVMMLLVQVPPVYLSLVWRSRLINEARLRGAAADIVDPLTGLATTPVLIERIMRIMARTQQGKGGKTSNALYLIEVQNWHGLLAELGADFNEKLLLEAAMRLRRSVGDNDLVARITGGRFAVVAQSLADQNDITSLATRLVVSGLRIDSPLLTGVEFRFRVIVLNLQLSAPLSLASAQVWLDSLISRFQAWPSTHRTRSILMAEDDGIVTQRLDIDSNY
jgi:GGDEF domain-containing protein